MPHEGVLDVTLPGFIAQAKKVKVIGIFEPTFRTLFADFRRKYSPTVSLALYSAYYIRYTADMSSRTPKRLTAERAQLLAELGTLSRLLHGSWVERYSVCARPACQCHRGARHGPRHYLVVNDAGHQRQKYVPNARVGAALQGLAQYRRLQEIVARVTQINLALLKEDEDETR